MNEGVRIGDDGRAEVCFVVRHAPIPQPRHKVSVMWISPAKQGRRAFRKCGCGCGRVPAKVPSGRLYIPDDHPVATWKFQVIDAWRNWMPKPGWRMDGPLEVRLEFIMPRPKAMVWKVKPMPRLRDDRTGGSRSSGDPDNLAKSVMDALTGVLWYDDGQVSRLEIQRWIAAGDEEPHAIVRARQVPMDVQVERDLELIDGSIADHEAELRRLRELRAKLKSIPQQQSLLDTE